MSAGKGAGVKVEHARITGGCRIRVTGVIDETLDPQRVIPAVDGVVVFDLDGVNRITSYGVREWLSTLSQLRFSWLGFANVRPAMVSQFNMISGFAGRGHIISMYLPYVCPTCNEAFEVKVDLRRYWAELAAFRVPQALCPNDQTPCELDDVPESYFSFVSTQPAPDPPPLVDRLLTDANEATGSLRIRKDVLGDVTGLWLTGPLDNKDHFRRLADGLEGTLYISTGGLVFGSEEGLGRLLNFLRAVPVPLVMGDLPVGLADRIAADPDLVEKATVCTLLLPAVCSEHGAITQKVEATDVTDALRGRPLVVFCPDCGRVCALGYRVAELSNLSTLRTAPMPDEVKAAIDAHEKSSADVTQAARTSFHPVGPQGTGVLERYQIVRPLGAGGMAEVFIAKQAGEGGFERQVVLKRILPGLSTDTEFVDMFLMEARLAARLSHPNVVQIFDVAKDAGQYFIVMELVQGWDLALMLRACIKRKQPFPPAIAARIAADVTRGLSAAHSYIDDKGKAQPIVHRDVSPHNVLVSAHGHVKLTDFGIAKAADSLSNTPTSLVKGKAPYLAPELVRDPNLEPDPRMDLFAAGLVLYQMLTLTHPFRRDNDMATFNALLAETQPPPSLVIPGLPKEIDRIAARALAKDPAQRYQSAAQFERDLEGFNVSIGATVTAADVARFISSIPELTPR
jgi:eukaryotic-like serine/threonine-protein kinase